MVETFCRVAMHLHLDNREKKQVLDVCSVLQSVLAGSHGTFALERDYEKRVREEVNSILTDANGSSALFLERTFAIQCLPDWSPLTYLESKHEELKMRIDQICEGLSDLVSDVADETDIYNWGMSNVTKRTANSFKKHMIDVTVVAIILVYIGKEHSVEGKEQECSQSVESAFQAPMFRPESRRSSTTCLVSVRQYALSKQERALAGAIGNLVGHELARMTFETVAPEMVREMTSFILDLRYGPKMSLQTLSRRVCLVGNHSREPCMFGGQHTECRNDCVDAFISRHGPCSLGQHLQRQNDFGLGEGRVNKVLCSLSQMVSKKIKCKFCESN